jgi:hypothetical protein
MAKYAMTDDETVAFAAALLGGVKWNGTIIQETGASRSMAGTHRVGQWTVRYDG